jgi:hypothetical protein
LGGGAAVDFTLGILLHFSLQYADPRASGLLDQAVANWAEKQQAGLTFMGDHAAEGFALLIQSGLVAGAVALLLLVLFSHARPRGATL